MVKRVPAKLNPHIEKQHSINVDIAPLGDKFPPLTSPVAFEDQTIDQ